MAQRQTTLTLLLFVRVFKIIEARCEGFDVSSEGIDIDICDSLSFIQTQANYTNLRIKAKHKSGMQTSTNNITNGHLEDIFAEVNDYGGLIWGAHSNDWLTFLIVISVLFMFDQTVLKNIVGSFRTHALLVILWIGIGLFYNAFVYFQHGPIIAMNWFNGYILEWMLSLDNLFVFHLIFQSYKTPSQMQAKALYIGILGAIVFRMIFFIIIGSLMDMFTVLRVLFGLFLCCSGFQAVQEDDDEFDAEKSGTSAFLVRLLGSRLDPRYDEQGRLFRFDTPSGKHRLTLLALVVLLIESTDILFACDSVSAKIAQIPGVYLNLTSSALAMFGLRATFFIISDLVQAFKLLKYGLCIVLVFVGIELAISPWTAVPGWVGLAVIASVFVTCITGSMALERKAVAAEAALSQCQQKKAAATEAAFISCQDATKDW